VNNYWKGHWIKHPAQCNLHGLPHDLVVDCLHDFIRAEAAEPGEIRHYDDWLIASYGETFARTFPFEYTKKYHTTVPENMSTDWLGPRLYRPDLREVLHGAVSPATPDVHYVDHFRYPKQGGFAAYLAPLPGLTNLHQRHKVVRIDPAARTIDFANGVSISYDHVVSSLPLPELIPLIEGAPPDVLDAASRLAATCCVLVNVGVGREDLCDTNWSYFYDEDYVFTRLSYPHNLSRSTVPEGASSIQAEVYFSDKYRPIEQPPESYIEPVLKDLRRCGLVREDDEILFQNAGFVPYANIIFDLERKAAVDLIFAYLADIGIPTCGRYGLWGYEWTDESFISGEKAAQTVIDRL
jgi:protoporphyrinogen oxidase